MYRLMKAFMMMLLLAAVSISYAQPGPDQCVPDAVVSVPGPEQSIVGIVDGNDCFRRDGEDDIIQINVNSSGLYTFYDYDDNVYLYLQTECCGGIEIASEYGEDQLRCIQLEQGVYYLLLEEDQDVDYDLRVSSCDDPCESASAALPEGESSQGDQIRWVHTTDGSSSLPYYDGPFQGNGCQLPSANPDGNTYGFDYYSWYNQDFGWAHNNAFGGEGTPQFCLDGDLSIDSAFVVICAFDVDFCVINAQSSSDPCERDEIRVNGQVVPPVYLKGLGTGSADQSLSVTWFSVPLNVLGDGSLVDVALDIDIGSDVCTWATTVEWSKLVVYATCEQIPEPEGYDLGDLGSPEGPFAEDCDYNTYSLPNGGPANAIYAQNVAWLGQCVDAEVNPNIPDLDQCDDGVEFLFTGDDTGWWPCSTVCVEVTVTLGPGYAGEPLYLWAWKDGNLDCDFEDFFCTVPADDAQVVADECIIQGQPVVQGMNSICFTDPGTYEFGRYNGYFRFRLMSMGPNELDCSTAQFTTDFALGETEDYVIEDIQLPVELMSFSAVSSNGKVRLNWMTASESNNDYFEIRRRASDGEWSRLEARIDGAGNSATNHSYAYVDEDVEIGGTYEYRLITVDFNGTRIIAAETEASVIAGAAAVDEYKLYANYPNPFNPSTTITYDLMDAALVTLNVFDVLGREVATLVNGYQSAGRYSLNFEAGALPSGVYFYRLETAQFSDMKKMMLLK